MQTLETGAAGLIGFHVDENLLAKGDSDLRLLDVTI